MQSSDSQIFAPGGFGRAFLDSHFSIPQMLAAFVSSAYGGLAPPEALETEQPLSREAA